MPLQCLNRGMRACRHIIDGLLFGLLLLVAVGPALAAEREVKSVQVRDSATGTRAEIILDSRAEYRVLPLSNPDRLVVDVLDTGLSAAARLPSGAGVVSAVRAGSPQPGVTRIVFDLAAPVVAIGPNLEWRGGQAVLVLQWPGDGRVGIVAAPVAAPVARAAEPPTPSVPSAEDMPTVKQGSGTIATGIPTRVATGTPTPTAEGIAKAAVSTTPDPAPQDAKDAVRGKNLRALVIAIDAGHGGQDTGALGASGTREKDITLKVARELARQVDATPGMKAYLTRDADFFIPLAQRYQKARAARADVFVSIHADAFTNPSASGSSVFVLSRRGASSQAARWLADQENAADLVGGVRLKDKSDTLASVLLDLSQSATQRASEAIAKDVLGGLSRIGKTHKDDIERANFVVLRSPDVPSMLVETAFISNPEEERRLSDPAYQQRLARAVLDGIHNYFSRLPPPGTWYAAKRSDALGEASMAGAGAAP